MDSKKLIGIVMNVDHGEVCSGVARFANAISSALSKDFRVRIFSTRSKEEGIKFFHPQPDVEILQFPMYPVIFPDVYIPRFSKKIKKYLQECDLIFIQTMDVPYPFYLSLKLRKPVIVYFHAFDWERAVRWGKLSRLIGFFMRRYCDYWYQKADHICLPSSSFRTYLVESEIKTPYSIVPVGLDARHFSPPVDKRAAKKQLGFDPDHLYLGYVGRIWGDKNLLSLTQVFLSLQQKYPQLRLLLVGGGIARYEKPLQEHPAILRVGKQENVVPFLHAMDIFCLPSLSETSSLATIEAMSCGLPVVANAVGCIPEYVTPGANGFLVDPPGDQEKLKEYLVSLIQNPGLREKMGERARETIIKRFHWNETARLLKTVFEHYLKPRDVQNASWMNASLRGPSLF